jgi:antitoxin VapB
MILGSKQFELLRSFKHLAERQLTLRPEMIYISGVHHEPEPMTKHAIGKLFMHGRSQAVRLPKEFRLPGKEVNVMRHGRGILIEPVERDVEAWLAELASYANESFMEHGREQPAMPEPEDIFD